MSKKIIITILLGVTVLALALLTSCAAGSFMATATPSQTESPVCEWPCTEQDRMTLQAMFATADTARTLTAQVSTPSETPTAVCANWPCPSDSLTLTASMSETFAALPSNTPPANLTYEPIVGDLGWGTVYGKVTDALTGEPISGATVTCQHNSYYSPARCEGITWTNDDGIYAFVPVFFHDTDKIILHVEAPGYDPKDFEQAFFTYPALQADIGLTVLGGDTPTPTEGPILMCTAPVCSAGKLTCGKPEGCPGGCGTICVTFTPTP